MKDSLHVAHALHLPLEIAARTSAIIAQKGAGKTYTALRITEELLLAAQQVVALDPTGVWWGLRAPAEGKHGPSFDVIVFGGEHADVPLEPTSGAIVARFAVESRRSMVLDMSGFESNSAQDRFATDFAESLYRLKAAERTTLHLMVDEADSFAPQRPMPGQQRMLGAFEAIVRRGRSRGLGITMISQRPAVLNKNVLSQADLLIALRVVGIHDHKALAEWASLFGTAKQRDEFMESLPKLATGEAWFWSPSWLGIFQRAKVNHRVTFDSSRTPEPGEIREAPSMVAVDLGALSAEISSSVQRAKENDPSAMKKQIAELQRELAKSREVKPEIERVEVPILTPSQEQALRDAVARVETAETSLKAIVTECRSAITTATQRAAPVPRANGAARAAAPAPARPASAVRAPVASANGTLGKAERMILTVLQQYGGPVEKSRVALIAGYSAGGGGFNNACSSLRIQGLVLGGDPMQITREGEHAIGDVPPLPTGAALLTYWQSQLGKAESTILNALFFTPRLSKEALADRCGYAANGGGFNNAISKLRTLKLVSGKGEIELAEDLR